MGGPSIEPMLKTFLLLAISRSMVSMESGKLWKLRSDRYPFVLEAMPSGTFVMARSTIRGRLKLSAADLGNILDCKPTLLTIRMMHMKSELWLSLLNQKGINNKIRVSRSRYVTKGKNYGDQIDDAEFIADTMVGVTSKLHLGD